MIFPPGATAASTMHGRTTTMKSKARPGQRIGFIVAFPLPKLIRHPDRVSGHCPHSRQTALSASRTANRFSSVEAGNPVLETIDSARSRYGALTSWADHRFDPFGLGLVASLKFKAHQMTRMAKSIDRRSHFRRARTKRGGLILINEANKMPISKLTLHAIELSVAS